MNMDEMDSKINARIRNASINRFLKKNKTNIFVVVLLIVLLIVSTIFTN